MRRQAGIKPFLFVGMILVLGGSAKNRFRQSSQLMVVCTRNWDQFQGKMQRFEKGSQGQWIPVSDAIPNVRRQKRTWVGYRTLPKGHSAKPQKREGNNRTSAGIFNIRAFSVNLVSIPAHMPLYMIKGTTEAVSDPDSLYYNEIVNASSVAEKDWCSSEKMTEIDLYDLGVVIDRNLPAQGLQTGACILCMSGTALNPHCWLHSHGKIRSKVGDSVAR